MRLLLTKLKPVAGIRNAQALAMMGNASRGSRPSRLSRISDGAYSPMPKAISAPSRKWTATATASPAIGRAVAVPPIGNSSRLLIAYRAAAMSSATPTMPCTSCTDARTTSGTPISDPSTAATMQEASSSGSTRTPRITR